MRNGLRNLLVAAVLIAAATWTRPAAAQRGGGDLGLGLIVGSPTGLSLEYGLSSSSALHFALGVEGFDNHGRDDDFYLHGVWKFYLAELTNTGDLSLPIYVGVGPYIANIGNDNIHIGARVPFGIALRFNTAPIDIFLELPLYLQVVDDVDVGIGGALGFHYFF